MQFVIAAIDEHKLSTQYNTALDAMLYASGRNATISKYQKLLYTLTGQTVPDNYTANHKCKSGFFKRFVTQEASYEVGNGVNFENPKTKEKLGGKKFDPVLYKGVKNAIIQGVSFGFCNLDHIEMYNLTEFVPLVDEENGSLMAGIRFWQLSDEKPLRATLYEVDGYTEYIKGKNETDLKVMQAKKKYKQIVVSSAADGTQIYDGENYPSFPIVPLYANFEHQSELIGKREQIDCYDLIKSGFANDLDDASMIYWTLTNTGGMSEIDLAKFIERMHTVKAAVVDNKDEDESGSVSAEAHTLDVPYQSREVYLNMLKKDLYDDYMALNVEQIAAGAVTATQIEAAYEPMNEKADELEMCLCEFIEGILNVLGIEDTPSFERSRINNQGEITQMVLSAANYLDDETILRKLPFLTSDEIDGILKRKDAEDMGRFTLDAKGKNAAEAKFEANKDNTEEQEGEVNADNAD